MRGGGFAAQTKLEDAGQAVFKALWSSSQQTALTLLETRQADTQAFHDANLQAKDAPGRSLQLDSISGRLEIQRASQRKAAQALADSVDPEDADRVRAYPPFKEALEVGDPVTVLRAMKSLQKEISPIDSIADFAQALAATTEAQCFEKGKDTHQFFDEMDVAARGVDGLMLSSTFPGQLTDAQKAYLIRTDAHRVLFLSLMNLSSTTHQHRLQFELAMDPVRLAALSPVEYKGLLLAHLAGRAPVDPPFAALSQGADSKKRGKISGPMPRLENGEIDFPKVLCFKCQSFGHFKRDCPDGASEEKAESATLLAIKELRAEMKNFRKTIKDEVLGAAAAHYALGGGIGPSFQSAEDSDEEEHPIRSA